MNDKQWGNNVDNSFQESTLWKLRYIHTHTVRTNSLVRLYYYDDGFISNNDASVVCFSLGKGLDKSHMYLYPEGKEFQVQPSEYMNMNIWW